MNWFQKKSHTKDIMGPSSHDDIRKRVFDPNACLIAYGKHWKQIVETIKSCQRDSCLAQDDMLVIINNLDQICSFVMMDLKANLGQFGLIMEQLISDKVLDSLNQYLMILPLNYSQILKMDVLKLYEIIVCNIQPQLLSESVIIGPLMVLLHKCCKSSNSEIQKRLVILLNQLCVLIAQNQDLLELFLFADENKKSSFVVLSALNMLVHHEGGVGQQARDALLLCLSCTKVNYKVAHSIVQNSHFCPIIGSSLSALFSLLPRKLSIDNQDWTNLTPSDVHSILPLENFINCLDFCNAALQVSHAVIRDSILEYIYHGFLELVLGPALYQNSVEEIFAVTSYLELFIRTIKEPCLLKLFLKLIFVKKFEDQFLIDVIIDRVKQSNKLAVISLSLLNTLVSLNCEDVMMQLVFKYLIPCTHVMLSQQEIIKIDDFSNYLPEAFLHLIPKCSENFDRFYPLGCKSPLFCRLNENSFLSDHMCSVSSVDHNDTKLEGDSSTKTKSHFLSSYVMHLREAKCQIEKCWEHCQCWTYSYDGFSPSPNEAQCDLHPFPNHSECCRRLSDSRIAARKTGTVNKTFNKPAFSVETTWFNNNNLPAAKEVYAVATNNPCDSLGNSSGYESFSNRIHDSRGQSPDELSEKYSLLFNCYLDLDGSPFSSVDIEDELCAIDKYFCDFQVPSNEDKSGVDNICKVTDVEDESSNGLQRKSRSFSHEFSSHVLDIPKAEIGAFLNNLLKKLENLLSNSLITNIQLLSIISRLAVYPQPLLKSFLLSTTLVFQPTIKSLLQILSSLKYKIDVMTSKVPNMNWYMSLAHLYLHEREMYLFHQPNNYNQFDKILNRSRSRSTSSVKNKAKEPRKRTITERLFGRPVDAQRDDASYEIHLEDKGESVGFKKVKASEDGAGDDCKSLFEEHPLLYIGVCSILLTEWLQEMAAISQEQAVLSHVYLLLDQFNNI